MEAFHGEDDREENKGDTAVVLDTLWGRDVIGAVGERGHSETPANHSWAMAVQERAVTLLGCFARTMATACKEE